MHFLFNCITGEIIYTDSGSQPCLHFFFFFLSFSRATPEAHGGSQAKGPVGAVAAGLCHSHSNTRAELHLQTTPQLMEMQDP